MLHDFQSDPQFADIKPFAGTVWLSSPTMHGGELRYMKQAFETNWMSTVGENIDETEKKLAAYTGVSHAVALSSGTAALHLAVRLAAEQLYGIPGSGAALGGRMVFCSDLTFAATVNPVVYEGGEAVLIDSEYDTWNMDPQALERAFAIYPQVRLAVVAHLYGMPANMDRIREICKRHGALLVEDAAESLGAVCQGKAAGSIGDYSIVSFNGNKIITGSGGGAFLTDSPECAQRIRKWSTQSRENAPWYQHTETGYNYRMSNVIAGVVRGQMDYLEEHIKAKREIYQLYKQGFKDLPVRMNPAESAESLSNCWMSCLVVDEDAMCETIRSEREYLYIREKGKTCPDEILDALRCFHAEGRPVWKPMHMQDLYKNNRFVTKGGERTAKGSSGAGDPSVGADLFRRGLCLPSDIKMTKEQQEQIIKIVRRCLE